MEFQYHHYLNLYSIIPWSEPTEWSEETEQLTVGEKKDIPIFYWTEGLYDGGMGRKWGGEWVREMSICVFNEAHFHIVKFYWASVLPFEKWDVFLPKSDWCQPKEGQTFQTFPIFPLIPKPISWIKTTKFTVNFTGSTCQLLQIQ